MVFHEKCSWYTNHTKKLNDSIPNLTLNDLPDHDPFFNLIKHQKSDYVINRNINCSYGVSEKETKCIKSFTYQIYPNRTQQKQLLSWFNECTKVYDCCVSMFNEDSGNFSRNFKKQKLVIFKELYDGRRKPAPYDMLTDEVNMFCKNLKSCTTNLRNGNITHYEMKPKSTTKGQSVLIPQKAIKSSGIFINKLKRMKGMDEINIDKIHCDSRLVYDNATRRFYLKCPIYCNTKTQNSKRNIVALDPGEKIFMTYHSPNDCGTIGNDFKQEILKYGTKINILNRAISRRINKKGKRITNLKTLKTRRMKYYRKINNIVKELHNKTALYLVKNYGKILLPAFETQNMMSTYGKKYIKSKIKELKDKPIEFKLEMIKVKKARRLSKRVKFVLNMMSHYKFKQHLQHKCVEYDCELEIVTEEYTSKCCSNCGTLSDKYDKKRVKKCPNCKFTNDRDINASKNILMKNHLNNISINRKTCMNTIRRKKSCMNTNRAINSLVL